MATNKAKNKAKAARRKQGWQMQEAVLLKDHERVRALRAQKAAAKKKQAETATIAKSRNIQYRERSANLMALGFNTYQKYLASTLWASIRSRVITGSTVCVRCTGSATQIHHGNYSLETLQGTSLVDLYPICGRCHRLIEFSHDGKLKYDTATATRRLLNHINRLPRKSEF